VVLDGDGKLVVRVVTVLVFQHVAVVLDAGDAQTVGTLDLAPNALGISDVTVPITVVVTRLRWLGAEVTGIRHVGASTW